MKRAWTVEEGSYHAHCDVVEERPGKISVTVVENGVEIARETVSAGSEASAMPYAIGVVGANLKDRLQTGVDAEIEKRSRPGA